MTIVYGHTRPPARGFSLIELTVVLLILAVTATLVGARLQGPLHRAQMRDVMESIDEFDRLSRAYAREHDEPLRFVVDLSGQCISRMDRRESLEMGQPLAMPPGYQMVRLLVRDQDVRTGSISISCSRMGLTPSYALKIQGPGGQTSWLVFGGLAGRGKVYADDSTIQSFWRDLAKRPDAG